MTALRHLTHLLRGTWFRRLFAVRFASQLTDGVFQVALASYVVFSPERAPDATAIAGALAVVLLPFSVLGPFVGVLLDRWSRRQVLAWSNFARVGLVALLAVAVHAGVRGALLFGLILVCLSVNRFLLAGLSAALPHVVRDDELVTANALTPTAGTLAFLVGLALGTGARPAWRGLGADSDVGVLATAAVLYGGAGLLALRIPRDLLGPDTPLQRPALRAEVRHVVSGLAAGLRHLAERRPAAYGLTAIGVHRFCYGLFSLSLILLYRNHFHGPGEADAAFNELAVAVLVSGAGFVTAAVLTPVAIEHLAPRTWVLALLAGAALTQVLPGALYTRPALLVAAFVLGLASQGIKIVVDTLVQTHVDDAYRGRVFSLYDVIFNVAFVAAAAVGAVVLPDSGRSYAVLGAVALGYVATALWYARATRTLTSTLPA
ncbi:MAG TPA: MFS transporter [Nocardioidaceae bacterium]|nr:MFS transporter [Nocardioidaceae bacterium]